MDTTSTGTHGNSVARNSLQTQTLPAFLSPFSRHSPTVAQAAPRPLICCLNSPQLSPRAQSLIQLQLKNPLFDSSKPSSDLSPLLSSLNSSSSYLSLAHLEPPHTPLHLAAEAIRIHTPTAIQKARAVIIDEFPGIDQPGGGLYPEFRAKACWRDLNEFARVAAYGAVCGTGVLSTTGVEIMKQVYEELKVPLEAMKKGVQVMADDIFSKCEQEEAMHVGAAFAELLEVLETF
eukprot:GFKZ01001909.1.p1 GENE.GFKZ01001909.1~~GFKZ01001909.1.p1  ORF type:complete len:233 (-),score=38.41 GFKZ01001909.1:1045-1743(-)